MDILSKVSLGISVASTHTDTFTLKLTAQSYLIFFFFYPYGLKTNLPCRHIHPMALILYIAHLLSPLLWTVTSCSHSLMWSHVHHLQHGMMSHTSSVAYKKKTTPLTSHKVTRVLLYLAFLFWICYVDHLLFSLHWIHTCVQEERNRDRNSLMTLNLV